MLRIATLLVCSFFFLSTLWADGPGYRIRVKLDHYNEKELVLGFYYGEKPYVKDTAVIQDGYFTFTADTLLPTGVYILVLKPKNDFIQFVLPADDQDFTVIADADDIIQKISFKGSDDNTYFYDYMHFLGKLRPQADTLRKQLEKAKGIARDSVRLSKALDDLDVSVKKYQKDFLAKYPNTCTAKMMRASIDPDAPEFKGDEKKRIEQMREWWRTHYFDNLDLGDPFLLRTPVLHPKVDQYVEKFTVPHPDSINFSLDYVLGKMKKSPETFKYYLVHFLNNYAKSNIVGMDACYVHLAENYYCTGQAPWVKSEELEKICDNAARLKPILIGKIAPNITVKDRNNQPHSLWDVDADYTVLFFWDPECGHCKKAAPFMVDFARQFKDKGVKVFAECVKNTKHAARNTFRPTSSLCRSRRSPSS
jgi:thiol-disulfide isomerase/thioredoxin